MKQLFVATLVIFLALPIACTRGTESTQAARESTRLTNSDLEKMVENQLKADPQLRETNISVSADADENRVMLSGTVGSEEMRNRALDAVRAARPGVTVEDKIDVKPPDLTH